MTDETVTKTLYDRIWRRCLSLEEENKYLRELLKTNNIDFHIHREVIPQDLGSSQQIEPLQNVTSPHINSLSKKSRIEDKVSLFMSLFHGRDDVYATRYENKIKGTSGYTPACSNAWIPSVCPRPLKSCHQCTTPAYIPYSSETVLQHLSGKDVIGIYAIQTDDTCYFLAIDLDEKNWQSDAHAIKEVCNENQIPCSLEKSRSGNGVHIWFYFSERIPATTARRMGSSIITLAMKSNAKLSFASYDRMFPNQDTLPKGGFGNLIALPLQPKAARVCGGSLFINDEGTPYPDQWEYLSSVQKLSLSDVKKVIAKIDIYPLGDLIPEEEKPWKRNSQKILPTNDPTKKLTCVLANQIFISTNDVSNAVQNNLKRLAAFQNPEFYQKQAMRMPTREIPRIICCAEFDGKYLCLPRGTEESIRDFASTNQIEIEWQDEQNSGREIHTSFTGSLYEEQQRALKALAKHDKGILLATTAFGKTVVAAALIAEKKVNTLILVHRTQLLKQWQSRLKDFLDIRDELPDSSQKHNQKRSIIGIYGSGKDTRNEIIDIAMMQSIEKNGEIPDWIGEYGLVIVDECHHISAITFEAILKRIRAKYSYGLTATLKRKDGHHPIVPMYLGPVRYKVEAKEQAVQRPFSHIMIPRFTGVTFPTENSSITHYYNQIIEDDMRNHLIVDDVLSCLKENRNCLVLSERVSHILTLAKLIQKDFPETFVLTGGKANSNILKAISTAPKDKPMIICATGKYIGEGFDESRLDTLFLTMPISWEGILAQYTGRLHRLYNDKKEVRIYDYIDAEASMFEKMYKKRLRAYSNLGYTVCAERSDTNICSDIIYDQKTFIEPFMDDIKNAKKSILIVSPYVNERRVNWLFQGINRNTHKLNITVITRPSESHTGKSSYSASKAIRLLHDFGVDTICKNAIHQKFAIIDEKIVWYGSINLLSFGTSEESIIRIITGSVARTLIKSIGL